MSVGLSSFLTSMPDASFRNPAPMPPRKNTAAKGGANAKPARKSASGNAGTKAKGKIAKGQSDKVKEAAEKKEAEKKVTYSGTVAASASARAAERSAAAERARTRVRTRGGRGRGGVPPRFLGGCSSTPSWPAALGSMSLRSPRRQFRTRAWAGAEQGLYFSHPWPEPLFFSRPTRCKTRARPADLER